PFETDPMPWYFLILIIGALSLWAMSRLRDSRLGRAWMAIREDETAADCTGVNPVSTKLLAFALGASFAGFAGSVYAAKLQAITPGAFEFQVSIMLLCMVVLGGAGSLRGVVLGAMLITIFDRVVLSQTTFLVRWLGRATGVSMLASIDLTLWRWFFFGLGLVLVMRLRPQGLAGRRVRPVAVDLGDEPAVPESAAPPRLEAIPGWLRARAAGVDSSAVVLDVHGVTKSFGGVVALNAVELVVPRGAIIGLIGPNGAGKTTFFNVVTGLVRPDAGRITFAGSSLVGLRPNAIVARGIARTFQSIRLFPHMTVLDNVLVGEHCRLDATVAGAVLRPPAVLAEERRARERARDLLAFVGLHGKNDDLARNLPYGDQRRLEIARARDRAAAPAARRANGGHEPARDRDPHRADRTRASRAVAVDLAHRARHGSRHGDLGSRQRTRLRHAHRRGHAGGDPAAPARHRGLPGHRLRGGGGRTERAAVAMLELADVHAYYGNIRALRGLSLSVERGEI